MRIFPFAGTRYGSAVDDPGRLAAPPYDQIDDQTRDRLHGEMLQFCQLTVPDPAGRPDPAHHAARLHREWGERGVVARDAEPGVYPYEILTAEGGRRLGLCALVGLETPEAGVVVPHEQTVTRFVEDRLHMLRTTGCDLEPILILADDHGAFDAALTAELEGAEPVVEHRDLYGHRHRLYAASAAGGYASLLAGATGVIADGNTRWQTARSRAAELGIAIGEAGAETAQATKLAVVTSLESPGVVIDPIHRALASARGLDRAVGLAASREPWSGDGGAAFAAAVAAAPPPALGVTVAGRPAEIWRLGDSSLEPARSVLVACRLHDELLPRLGLGPESASDGTVTYRSDPDQLWRELAAGEHAVCFFLPPMSPRTFGDAIAAGELMPPKSTRFLPKLVSGLVWHDQAPPKAP
jgi:uncharacterized protein (DUF1015 family)